MGVFSRFFSGRFVLDRISVLPVREANIVRVRDLSGQSATRGEFGHCTDFFSAYVHMFSLSVLTLPANEEVSLNVD